MVFDGELLIYIEEAGVKKPLAYNKSATLSVKLDTKEIVTKEDGEWAEKLAGRLNWSSSGDGSYCLDAETSNTSADMIFDKMISRTPVNMVFGIEGSTATYKGKAFLTNWELSSGAGEVPTYQTSLDGTGPLTKVARNAVNYGAANLRVTVLSATSASFNYNLFGTGYNSVSLEVSPDGITGWAIVGAADTAEPYATYQLATVAAGTKYYRIKVTNGTNPVYSNVVVVAI